MMRFVRYGLLMLLFIMLAGRGFAQPNMPNILFTVNITQDFPDLQPGDGRCDVVNDSISAGDQCSLRAAIQEENALIGNGTIVVPSGVYTLVRNGNYEDQAAFGDLDITDDMTIIGAQSGSTIIQGEPDWDDRIFDIHPNTKVNFSLLTIQHGQAQQGNYTVSGGGIRNRGNLTLLASTITNNTAGEGGGIYSTGDLTIKTSTISSNYSLMQDGGGIFINTGGSLNLSASLVNMNGAEKQAGGIMLACNATANIFNTTISMNKANTHGGGLIVSCAVGSVALNNVTIVDNHADAYAYYGGIGSGGGISNTDGGNVTIANSIVAGNYRGNGIADDCNGTLTSQGYNLVQSLNNCTLTGTTTGNITGQDPHLGLLQVNNGNTQNYAPLLGSPALNAGNPATPNSGNGTCAATDQRNVSRPVDGRCDIGSVEVQISSVFIPLVLK